MEQGHVSGDIFFPELIARRYYVLVIHGLATPKKKNPFLSLTGLAEIWRREVFIYSFLQICVAIFLTKAIKMRQRMNGQIAHWQTWRTDCYCFVARTQKTHTWRRTLQS